MSLPLGGGKSWHFPELYARQREYELLGDRAIDASDGWAEGLINGMKVVALTQQMVDELIRQTGEGAPSSHVVERSDGWIVHFYRNEG